MVSSSEPTAILCDSSNRDEALEEDSDMEDDGTIPTILISREEKKRIRTPWLNSLIIKAFGTDKAGYNFIFPRIKAQWKPRGKMDCIDLGLDFFLIRFHEKEDLNRVLHGGPWFVGPHFLTIRSDGSALGNPGMAGAGGLLRDHLGRWIIGFSRNIGWTTSIAAELWAIRDGLEVAISKGFSKIIVETDSKIATILIESADISLHSLGILISDCRSLLGCFADAQISHIYREANTAADFMAKLGTSSATNFVLYDGSPPGISSFLYHGCIGTVFPRIAVAV
ncbi:hypothetical protein SLEP1_g48538 [Rubroshorea leprosula]|uniref:RNase H type-1 domain-containing protein n=1 Tax=Rubroshorea leprosula TaxID=152421 RepID=A0AAV5LU12_9ROSI|nr:hypothetical protein SLEP1_g48538 [Rubroshorea leprosula]